MEVILCPLNFYVASSCMRTEGAYFLQLKKCAIFARLNRTNYDYYEKR